MFQSTLKLSKRFNGKQIYSATNKLFSSCSVLRTSDLPITSLIFFTKETCSLCTRAKEVLNKTLANDKLKSLNFPVTHIDIMNPKNQEWFDKYCFDVPVLHVNREGQKEPVKFMHYFKEEQITEELLKKSEL